MSVKRTVYGSTSGNLSVRPIAMSSTLSQSNVGGMSLPKTLASENERYKTSCVLRLLLPVICSVFPSVPVQFLRVILVPLRNLHHNVRRPVRHGLATETRFRRNPWCLVELIQLRVRRLVARFQAFFHHHVTRRAGTHATASMVQPHLK